MLITVASRKGGVGKTTLATNLVAARAAAGHTVKLIDADSDEYAYMWGQLRRQNGVEPDIRLAKMTGSIYSDLVAEKTGDHTTIVDVGGKHSPELIYAVGACDVLVLPVRAGQFDVWSLSAMGQLIRECRAKGVNFKVIPVMNAISPMERSTLTRGLTHELEQMRELFECEPLKVVQRNAYSMAAMQGRGVTELKAERDTHDAQAEIMKLYEEVFL